MTPRWSHSIRACALVVLCMLFMRSEAHASETTLEWSDFAKTSLCSGDVVRMDDHTIMYSVPEPAVTGDVRKRLYVGYVEDLHSSGKVQAFYLGPLAKDWINPRVPIGERAVWTGGSLRYWINRKLSDIDPPGQSETVEIDLRAKPPVVRTLARKPGAPVQEALIPLDPLPLTSSTLALARGFTDQPVRTSTLVLRPFDIKVEGNYSSSLNKPTPNPENPFFLVVSASDGSRCVIHSLHKAPFWVFGRVLEYPKSGASPTFLIEMIETYKPHDSKSESRQYHRKVHVRVGLDGIESKVVEDRLYYDAEESEYRKVER